MRPPRSLEEWDAGREARRQRARELIPPGGYRQPRQRPRDPDEEAALCRLGLGRHRPFVALHATPHPALQVKAARLAAALSQTELARRMGISQQQLQQLEDPSRANPTWKTLERVARALGCRIELTLEP